MEFGYIASENGLRKLSHLKMGKVRHQKFREHFPADPIRMKQSQGYSHRLYSIQPIPLISKKALTSCVVSAALPSEVSWAKIGFYFTQAQLKMKSLSRIYTLVSNNEQIQRVQLKE